MTSAGAPMPEAPAAAGTPATAGRVRRRHVFYLAGFDPKSERYVHALYRREAARQAAAGGCAVSVGRERTATDGPGHAWTLASTAADGGRVQTTFELLAWDDLVRAHWVERAGPVLRDGLRTVAWGLRSGAVQRMFRLGRPPVYATLFPLAVLAAGALLAAALGGALGLGAAALLRPHAPAAAAALGAGLGLAAAAALFVALAAAVHRLQFTWLLRLVHFSRRHASGQVPALDARVADFAARIDRVLQAAAGADLGAGPGAGAASRLAASADTDTDTGSGSGSDTGPDAVPADTPDEVLLIGHSVGATLGVSVLARLLERRAAAGRPGTPGLAFLSLGHCLPLMTALGPAAAFRADLQRVAQAPIDWLDVSAPIDWVAFPGIDPVTGAGLPPAPPGWHPQRLSPRFHQAFGPATYARLRRNRFQVHLQYLMATERPVRYDFFGITGGALSLRERFAEDQAGAPDAQAGRAAASE
ncbi:hypothetical protein [Piscinibacter sakaiensis]|uniref:Integral membrane protein Cj1412c n=1 Tax=Piscinibacter sakaiensis TaxID=1547922 RepID=A0A0K8P7T4_PISS1|nr:hypothetical protein [Piscinibacter sakaiensis]GAP38682.1 hypothetical protein ISF6_5235 [Piscinibacter sakaiensis]